MSYRKIKPFKCETCDEEFNTHTKYESHKCKNIYEIKIEIYNSMEVYNKHIIDNTKGASEFIKVSGFPEASLIEWCKQFLRPDGIMIDIGAHCGSYSIALAPYVKQVHAFEAERKTFYQLCGGIALNDMHEKITAYNYGITDDVESGSCKLLNVVSLDGGGSTFDKIDLILRHVPILRNEIVNMKCIDDFDLYNICFIKMDVENYELKALKGMLNTIFNSNYPPILFESNKEGLLRTAIFEFLEKNTYKISQINGYSNMFLANIF